MSTVDIYNAFAEQVSTFAAALTLPLPVSYPSVEFSPPNSGMWLEAIVFWNGSSNYGLANDGPHIESGFFRVGVVFRPTVGLSVPQAIAEGLLTAFPKGTQFATALQESAGSISGPLEQVDRTIIPVTFQWRATRVS